MKIADVIDYMRNKDIRSIKETPKPGEFVVTFKNGKEMFIETERHLGLVDSK